MSFKTKVWALFGVISFLYSSLWFLALTLALCSEAFAVVAFCLLAVYLSSQIRSICFTLKHILKDCDDIDSFSKKFENIIARRRQILLKEGEDK